MMKNIRHKKMAVTIVAAILLVILYGFIFSFSEQDGETSKGFSYKVSVICTEILNTLSGKNMSQSRMEALALYFEHPIRKVAHFTEYAVMGFLIGIILLTNRKDDRIRKLFAVTVLWVFLSASGDEIHQLFVPDRYGNLADVCLDTCGGMFGFYVNYCVFRLCRLFGMPGFPKRMNKKS